MVSGGHEDWHGSPSSSTGQGNFGPVLRRLMRFYGAEGCRECGIEGERPIPALQRLFRRCNTPSRAIPRNAQRSAFPGSRSSARLLRRIASSHRSWCASRYACSSCSSARSRNARCCLHFVFFSSTMAVQLQRSACSSPILMRLPIIDRAIGISFHFSHHLEILRGENGTNARVPLREVVQTG